MAFAFYKYSWGSSLVGFHTYFVLAARDIDHAIKKVRSSSIIPLKLGYNSIMPIIVDREKGSATGSVEQIYLTENSAFGDFIMEIVPITEEEFQREVVTHSIPHVGHSNDEDREDIKLLEQAERKLNPKKMGWKKGRPRKNPHADPLAELVMLKEELKELHRFLRSTWKDDPRHDNASAEAAEAMDCVEKAIPEEARKYMAFKEMKYEYA